MADPSTAQSSPAGQAKVDTGATATGEFFSISPGLQVTLQHVVDDVVASLDCIGAMVATLEPDNTLPVRAYSVNLAPALLKQLEDKLGLTFVNPRSVAYLDDPEFQENLSVRAIKGQQGRPEKFIVSDHLYDLFRPVVGKPLSDLAQALTQIRQVIAIPFFLEDEVVGNLFAATRTQFSTRDINFLTAFGHQAATALQSQARLDQAQALESVIFDLQASLTDEGRALKVITDAVVDKLGYLAALVAPRIGNDLPVRAYSVNSHLISQDFIDTWQRQMDFQLIGDRAVAHLDRPDYAEQLSVRAVKSGQVQVSSHLYDLVRPVIPRPPVETIQHLLGIQQVIAIPFFLENETIGNMYVISKRPRFSAREQMVLQALAQHATLSIRNAQLYQKSEERREAAQIFAKMAFGAAASVHTLRNHIGLFRVYLQLARPQLDETAFQELGEGVTTRLNQAADILDNLHEPWREKPDSPTEINTCLNRALAKIAPDLDEIKTRKGISVHLALAENLPPVTTSPDMLTEAFMVLIKNAVESIQEKFSGGPAEGHIRLKTGPAGTDRVEVVIQDNGTGIKADNLHKVFELGWSTRTAGMGFGLFWTKDYIEGLKGNITVESVWQEGTTFRVSLPAMAS